MVKKDPAIITFRHGNDGLNDSTSEATSFANTNEKGEYDRGMTTQADKDDSDINVIVKRFGIGARQTNKQPLWGDFTAMPHDYQDAMTTVTETRDKFNSMPAEVRKRFANNPYEMLTWIQNPANRAEAAELGIIPKPAPAAEPAPKPTPEPKPA